MASDHLTFVNVFEHVSDHWRGMRTAVHGLANITFVNDCKRISRLISRQKSGEPRRGALFVFWSPLRGAGFTGDFDIFETGLMRGAAAAVHNIDHSSTHFFQRLWRDIERSLSAHLIGGDDLVIERLH